MGHDTATATVCRYCGHELVLNDMRTRWLRKHAPAAEDAVVCPQSPIKAVGFRRHEPREDLAE
ncbi:hypothetical protein ACIBG7_15335 [Nonomuraea sp. NPDC050328]|uniref:hypothetical protein n=1 Tax=Nonomuraea sp. NPDC050328 TaxID=3364361 RepID=UPI0037B19F02